MAEHTGRGSGVVVGVVAGMYAAALVLGVLGFFVGGALPCTDRGFQCLAVPFWWGGWGAVLGVLLAGWWGARAGMRWWWGPLTLVGVALGTALGGLTTSWVGLVVALLAPVGAALLSRPRAGLPGAGGRGVGRSVLVGVALVGLGIALVAGVWKLDDLGKRRDLVSGLESMGVPFYAPAERDDLVISHLYSGGPGGSDRVHYTVRKDGDRQSWISVEVGRPMELACEQTQSLTCTEADGVVVANRDDDWVSVFRQTDDSSIRVGPHSGSSDLNGWTIEELMTLARDLEPVEGKWLGRRAERYG